MAPPTRGRGGQSRGSTTSAPRKSTRGGIQKTRSRPIRVDRDGDLDMDAGSGARRSNRPPPTDPGTGRPQRQGATTRSTTKIQQVISRHLSGEGTDMVSKRKPQGGPLVWLEVKGLKESKAASNPDGGLRDLLAFLERKATGVASRIRPVVVKKVCLAIGDAQGSHIGVPNGPSSLNRQGAVVQIASSKEDAEEIIKLNNFSFAGAKLEISDSDGSLAQANAASAQAQDVKSKLTDVLSQRYMTDTKLLKLDALSQDQALVAMGILESKDRVEKMFRVMMKICDELFKTAKDKIDNIQSISLANNGIENATQVEELADTFPDLVHLEFSGNQISTVAQLAAWKGKFRKLETLHLNGNPIPVADLKTRAALVEYFPKLRDLNGEQLTPEHIEQLRAATRPAPIPQHGPDFRDANGIGETFLVDFFAAFDADRHGLLAKYYDEESQFSLAVDTNSIRNKDAPPPLSWSTYIPKSRNLTRITTPGARAARLLTGRESIFKIWSELPATQHPNIKEDISKYIMDCHLLSGLADPSGSTGIGHDGMIISVHGQFEEYDAASSQRGLRSFSRSFVLGPGRPGNNPIRVVSDMLLLRAYNPLPNIFAAGTAQPEPSDDQALRQAKIAELSKQTNMIPAYSEMCLSEVGWDFDQAVAKFHETKAVLPANAFASV
ncbi:mRNA export factor mex67 [Sodiomyces alkalinus F11]|uniref:mRNA export factor mex67 n=1 Tax=Sodiomyces alkalinus (strain CBS 110278 / VKM F-3762 / F11) TaxID=1314773 RepID=A0A3N2Q000_SODAK|nr:mRNA export factor mex67 [Sodiomyces alkalinus F11]ROT40062.1 mRNA export factor mex67 [Sodiomyces alkalinus F11]